MTMTSTHPPLRWLSGGGTWRAHLRDLRRPKDTVAPAGPDARQDHSAYGSVNVAVTRCPGVAGDTTGRWSCDCGQPWHLSTFLMRPATAYEEHRTLASPEYPVSGHASLDEAQEAAQALADATVTPDARSDLFYSRARRAEARADGDAARARVLGDESARSELLSDVEHRRARATALREAAAWADPRPAGPAARWLAVHQIRGGDTAPLAEVVDIANARAAALEVSAVRTLLAMAPEWVGDVGTLLTVVTVATAA